ncbi:MAG: hypothetical protein EXR77_03235 [Myxococcales bacterium]|nr:hypothetical protein [Myxococcales bacterium]
MQPPSTQPLSKLAQALQQALQHDLPGAQIDIDDGGDAVALTFEHPAHHALCIAILEPDATADVALLAAVVVADVAELSSPQALLGLMTFNARLMTCALAALPINQDEMAIVLCRRTPAAAMPPTELAALYNDMIWEWAQVSKHADEFLGQGPTAAPRAPAPPSRPRIIGSLDEF